MIEVQCYDGDGVRPALPANSREYDYDRPARESGSLMLGDVEYLYDFSKRKNGLREGIDIFWVGGETETHPYLSRPVEDYRNDPKLVKPIVDSRNVVTRYDWADDISVGNVADMISNEPKLVIK